MLTKPLTAQPPATGAGNTPPDNPIPTMNTKYLDTRDLYERKSELLDFKRALDEAREELAEAEQALANITPDDDGEQIENDIENARDTVAAAEIAFGTDEETELRELEELESEMDARSFRDGVTLVPESDFEDHARDEAEQLGLVPDDAQWPCTCIDWAMAADALRQDYTSVTFQGTDYLYRE